MNLLLDPWIPIRRSSGLVERIAPWQLTERLDDDPALRPASPRADFDGALVQFLVGLLQTALAPKNSREWRQRLLSPPSPGELRAVLEPMAHAFELFGDGPRFLQDLTLTPEEAGEPNAIEALLIESPGENTVKRGVNHFVRGGLATALCPTCAAAALITLQANAPSGGQGHRTSLRGGGPLTTVAWTEMGLWPGLWLNVLTEADFNALSGSAELTGPEHRFPWLAPTRTSEKNRPPTTALDVHPLQKYWAMPRRIRLLPELTRAGEACALCGEGTSLLVRRYLTKNYGVNYTGPWRHPLTPAYQDKDGTFISRKGDAAALSYRHWLGLVCADRDKLRFPAPVAERFTKDSADPESTLSGLAPRLWGFGFEMDNMKALAWCEGTMPLWVGPEDLRTQIEREGGRLVLAARYAASVLVGALKQAFSRQGGKLKGDLSPYEGRHWEATEPAFYRALDQLAALLVAREETEPLRRSWHRQLAAAAFSLFDEVSGFGDFRAVSPRQVTRARQSLLRQLWAKKMRELLDLAQLAEPRETEETAA